MSYPKVYLYRRMVQAKLYIDAHYADAIDLNNIADEASFSKFHFIRLFKKIYQCTPHQYLIKVRIEHAKDFLKDDLSITDVCYRIGFESISSFSSLFKNITGTSPLLYQQNQRKIKSQIKTAPLTFIPRCYAEKKGWIKNSNFEEAQV
jgi:AraC-like DNA-binding protein